VVSALAVQLRVLEGKNPIIQPEILDGVSAPELSSDIETREVTVNVDVMFSEAEDSATEE
jgi:hypothetical protein